MMPIRFFNKLFRPLFFSVILIGSLVSIIYADFLAPDQIAYLKQHEVSSPTKKKLDAFLGSPSIKKLLSIIYKVDRNNSKKYEAAKKARKALIAKGFAFLGGKFNIFTIDRFPGFVFKMALPHDDRPEPFNANRIAFRQTIDSVVQDDNLPVILPKKDAWFMPGFEQDVEDKYPKVIIRAKWIDLSGAKPITKTIGKWKDRESLIKQYKVDSSLLLQSDDEAVIPDPQAQQIGVWDAFKRIQDRTGYLDLHDDNVLRKGNYLIILDTEERRQPGFMSNIQQAAGGAMDAIVGIFKPGNNK
ncbi:MAG TPA: hypothetical protein VFF04_01675 [Candidatus Babeliales bacterium]|nr:hypothetical protein [Candidatus Babeliales bacterium]